MSSRTRLYLAIFAFSSWITLLLTGWGPAGWVQLLLVAALVLFPWAQVRQESRRSGADADEGS